MPPVAVGRVRITRVHDDFVFAYASAAMGTLVRTPPGGGLPLLAGGVRASSRSDLGARQSLADTYLGYCDLDTASCPPRVYWPWCAAAACVYRVDLGADCRHCVDGHRATNDLPREWSPWGGPDSCCSWQSSAKASPSGYPIAKPKRPTAVLVATIPHVMCAILLPPALAACIAGLAMPIDEVRHRRSVDRALSNTACTACSVGLTALVGNRPRP